MDGQEQDERLDPAGVAEMENLLDTMPDSVLFHALERRYQVMFFVGENKTADNFSYYGAGESLAILGAIEYGKHHLLGDIAERGAKGTDK